ncbi:MAG: glycosyl transferase family 9 [Phycisphaerales bacterium]|nr:glycosyl transferase family 9 [Phycisphaerales bacterium]
MMTGSIQHSLDAAARLHQAGRLAEAEAAYRTILASQPDHPHALHLLGTLAYQTGRLAPAADLFLRAAATHPDPADCHGNRGVALAGLGRLEEAVAAYRQALAQRPRFPEALNNLGSALQQSGRPEQAIECYEHALAVRPDYPEAHNNLGNALREQTHTEAAIAAYRQALRLRPRYAEAWNNLGSALAEYGSNDEAIAACARALELRPAFPEALNNLANALKKQGRLDEAIAACRRAIALQPALADAWTNLGNALQRQGHFEDSIFAYRRAIALRPDSAIAHVCLGLALLLKGEFPEGWREFEWRWRTAEFRTRRRHFTQPLWDGGDLQGKRILLHAEGGLGDAIQFVRYLPAVAARGGRIVLEATPQLRRLFAALPHVQQFVPAREPLPDFDVHCPLMSLPLVLNTTLATVPAPLPYLSPDPELAARWRSRMPAECTVFKVGLVWAGRAYPDPGRSIEPELLVLLRQLSGTWMCSLQRYESPMAQIAAPPGMGLVDWTAELPDLADTAALISELDLVITVDTVIAHLAGAMGKRVWVLLQFAPDWRWLLDRQDCPWYPTMRLFRQPSMGEWESAVREVARELESLVGSVAREVKTS